MNPRISLARLDDFEGIINRVLVSDSNGQLRWFLDVLLSPDSAEKDDIVALLSPSSGSNSDAAASRVTLGDFFYSFFRQGTIDCQSAILDGTVRFDRSLSRKTNYCPLPSDGNYRPYVRAQARDAILFRMQSEYLRGFRAEQRRALKERPVPLLPAPLSLTGLSQRSFYKWAREIADYYRVQSILVICNGDGEDCIRELSSTGSELAGIDSSIHIEEYAENAKKCSWSAIPSDDVPFSLGRTFDLVICRELTGRKDAVFKRENLVRLHSHSRTLALCGTAQLTMEESASFQEDSVFPDEGFSNQLAHHQLIVREYSPSSRGSNLMHAAFCKPQPLFVDEPVISFLMVVTPRDLSIAEFAVRSYALLAGLPFKLFVYANCLSKDEEARVVREWSAFPWVEVIVPPFPGLKSDKENVTFGFGAEGPYERCEVPWDVELPKLPGRFVGIVDADFEILHPAFVERTISVLQEAPELAAVSVSMTPTGDHDESIVYMSRLNTWYLIFSRTVFNFSLSNLPCHQHFANAIGKGVYWDSTGLRQKILTDVMGSRVALLEPEFDDCSIHYGAFSKYTGIEGSDIKLYRLLKILMKIGGAETVRKRSYQRFVEEFEGWARSVSFTIPEGLDLRVVATAVFDHLFKEVQSTNRFKNAQTR